MGDELKNSQKIAFFHDIEKFDWMHQQISEAYKNINAKNDDVIIETVDHCIHVLSSSRLLISVEVVDNGES